MRQKSEANILGLYDTITFTEILCFLISGNKWMLLLTKAEEKNLASISNSYSVLICQLYLCTEKYK